VNVFAEQADPASMLHLYRRVLAARRASPALHAGDLRLLDDLPEGVLGYERSADSDSDTDTDGEGSGDGSADRRVVLINFTDEAVAVAAVAGTVVVSTHAAAEGAPFDGGLGPDQAVDLQP
jgi:glycosidase